MDYQKKAQIIEFILRADNLIIKYAKMEEFIKRASENQDINQIYSEVQKRKKKRLQQMIAEAELDLFSDD